MIRAEAEDGAGVLGENHDDIAVGGEGVHVELVEVGKRAVIGDEFVDARKSGVDEVEFEFVDRAVRLLAGEGGHFVEEGVKLLFQFFEFPDVFFGVHWDDCSRK